MGWLIQGCVSQLPDAFTFVDFLLQQFVIQHAQLAPALTHILQAAEAASKRMEFETHHQKRTENSGYPRPLCSDIFSSKRGQKKRRKLLLDKNASRHEVLIVTLLPV